MRFSYEIFSMIPAYFRIEIFAKWACMVLLGAKKLNSFVNICSFLRNCLMIFCEFFFIGHFLGQSDWGKNHDSV